MFTTSLDTQQPIESASVISQKAKEIKEDK